jgi:hypothetical protein
MRSVKTGGPAESQTESETDTEREERLFQPHLPNTSHSNKSHSKSTSHPSFERSHSSNVDWRTVARGSESPTGRHMPGGGKLIGSSLTGSSGLGRSGRSLSMGSSAELSTGSGPVRCNGDAAAPSTLSELSSGATIPWHPYPSSGRASAVLAC